MKSLIKQVLATISLITLLTVQVFASSSVTFYHHDALGSVVAATDQAGAIVWQEEYQPYGGKITPVSTDEQTGNSDWYTGKSYDESLDLTYFGARWYDAKQGRFLSIDPAPVTIENIHSFNRYHYANNNPYKYVDPDGETPELIFMTDPQAYMEHFVAPVLGVDANTRSGNAAIRQAMHDEAIMEVVGLVVGAGVGKAFSSIGKVDIKAPYSRPSGSTTPAQRASVQGKPCIKCGAETPRQIAGHKKALVEEYYETGTIDKVRMRRTDAVQPECQTCSSREGAEMSRFSRKKKQEYGFE
jgi:RHS repeat-associated protein